MKYPPEPLTTDECRRLIGACSPRCPTGLRNRALIVTLWRGGLRCSESLALHPRDLDNGVLAGAAGQGREVPNRRPRPRSVGRPDRLGLNGRPEWASVAPCSPRCAGNPCKRPTSAACSRDWAGRPTSPSGATPTGCATRLPPSLADEKVDISIIQRALGHSSLGTTARYVDHLNPRAVIDALKSRTW